MVLEHRLTGERARFKYVFHHITWALSDIEKLNVKLSFLICGLEI